MSSVSHLSTKHLDELKASAIDPEIIRVRGYRTIADPDELPEMFAAYQRRPGLLIPIRDTTGTLVTYQLKADTPRLGKDAKPIKYETASGGRQCLDIPEWSRQHLGDPSTELVITEGAKKVDSALSHGMVCVVGVNGVYGWRGKNQHGGSVALPDWEDIATNGRTTCLAFDSDMMTKDGPRHGLERLGALLASRGATVSYIVMPNLAGGSKCGLDDWFASGRTVEDLRPCVHESLPPAATDWHEPVSLDDMTGPAFPVNQLPDPMAVPVTATSEETQTPPDMGATVALGTISAAAGGKYEISIPESGWREPVHVQLLAIAEPGARKTEVFRRKTKPLSDYERTVNPDEVKKLAEWASQLRALEHKLSTTEKAVNKPGKDGAIPVSDSVRIEAVRALEDHKVTKPRATRIIADDVTVEAVKGLLAEQGGAIAVMSAESTFLSICAGRYGDTPNLDVLLNGHAADSVRVNRRGRDEETIERACLTLCLMAQPHVIRELGKVPGFRERGAAARLLPSIATDIVGHRRIDVAPVPYHILERWHKLITTIVARTPTMENGCYVPWTITLDTAALSQFREYRVWHEAQMGKDGAFADIRDWAAKQCGAVLRIAGLLHIATQSDAGHYPETKPITADTISRAIAIAGYYEQHARTMYRLMRGTSSHGGARAVLTALRTLQDTDGPESPITRRDLHRKLQDRVAFASSADLSAPLDLLEEYGWIRRERSTKEQRGRPSERIFLNPWKYPDNTDRTSPVHDDAADSGGIVGIVRVSGESENISPFPPDPLDSSLDDVSFPDDGDAWAYQYEVV